MNPFTTWQSWALNRGRVANTRTETTGNLCDWPRGQHCKVFVGYGEWIGAYRPALFEMWLKAETQIESNAVPVGRSTCQYGKGCESD